MCVRLDGRAGVVGPHSGAAPELSVECVLAQCRSRRRADAVDIALLGGGQRRSRGLPGRGGRAEQLGGAVLVARQGLRACQALAGPGDRTRIAELARDGQAVGVEGTGGRRVAALRASVPRLISANISPGL